MGQLTVTWDAPQRAPRSRSRRDDIYDFICAYADEKDGPTPSIREVAKAFGVYYSTAYHHVMKLIIDGRLRQEDGKLIVVGSEWIAPER
ncbi:MAG TPA: hypothetical protein PKD09_25065 [Aggregatilinea sp.]|uniref:hypothetical protein n=1 Tax=Aggregatilinea sp. TaxID=2806333 RepID=UPI002BD68F99|nr:hypothetical protein [Aggregatilinea sp.]HML24949.1 hypothetical protein [Aggregatilinea sp.]